MSSAGGDTAAGGGSVKTPADFLKSIRGLPVVVKTELKGRLQRLLLFMGGPLEFLFVLESDDDPAYHAVSLLISEFKGSVDAKILLAGLSTTCSQKIHNQLVLKRCTTTASMFCFKMMMFGCIQGQLEL